MPMIITKQYNIQQMDGTTGTIPNKPTPIIEHNIKLLKEYYTRYQHNHYKNIVNIHFNLVQNRDTRFIPPPTRMTLIQISTIECNPKNDIITVENTIQT